LRVRIKRIELLVEQLLHKHAVGGPPVPIEAIAQSEGLDIRLQPLESNLSGFLYRQDSKAVIGANSLQAAVRQRFTIAHELGHYFLHDEEQLHVDRAAHFRLRSNLASQGVDTGEIEANRFAAELLMPKAMVEADMQGATGVDVLDEDFVSKVARRYGVSSQAMVLRLTNLGYVEQ
jgi:Zn-dependent peptidase ImmA (M78 family)